MDLSFSLPKRCVISFFGDAVQEYVHENGCEMAGSLRMETYSIPVYSIEDEHSESVALLHAFGSGSYGAAQIEKLIALGCNTFFVCGGCGVLVKGSQTGDLYIPIAAVRDEGTSYHYVKPARDIKMDPAIVETMCNYLSSEGIPYQCVKTWTTDAIYRETRDMVSLRVNEGCSVVDMECASYLAVAQYKHVKLGQLLYAGDDLSGLKWDGRDWKSKKDVRKALLSLSINLCRLI